MNIHCLAFVSTNLFGNRTKITLCFQFSLHAAENLRQLDIYCQKGTNTRQKADVLPSIESTCLNFLF